MTDTTPCILDDPTGGALRDLINERNALMNTMIEIAAFDDERANRRLERQRSYSWFDEPKAVEKARTVLGAISGQGAPNPAPAPTIEPTDNLIDMAVAAAKSGFKRSTRLPPTSWKEPADV
jgi:hypothetical protein